MRMESTIFCVVFAAAVVNVAAAAAAGEQPCAPSRKFVGFAWEFSRMSLRDLAPYADELDKTPLNGIGVYLNEKTPDGTLVSTHNIMHALWNRDALQPLVPLARELTAHTSMRESFIGTFRAPAKRIDWSDDARWGAIATNMAIAAWFAKAGGFRGISMDPEDYRHSGQFRRRGGDAPYEELCRLVRQRGREVFSGVFREYPDVRILSFWLLSLTHTYLASDDPARDAAENGDLWPAFVDGILDVAPPGALIVDGNEHSYRYKAGRGDFARTAIAVRSRLSALVSPGNRDKYRRQVSVSFGLYLDMYTNPPGSSWFFGPLNGSRLGRFAANLHAAAESADEYVWFWGEKHCWADWRGKGPSDERKISHDTWESRLPGMEDEILLQKAPGEFVRNRVAKLKDAGLLRPVNANPGCTGVGDAVPPPYSVWRQKGTKPGRFFRDSVSADGDGSSLAADGVEDGAISVSLPREPKPGERFLVSTFAKGDGVSASVAWKRNGKFDWNVLAPVQLRFGSANAEGWREGEALVCVPRGADGMSLIISVRQKPDTSGICRIDAVKIQPLDLRTIDLFTAGADALGLLDGHVQGIAATDDALYMSQMKRIVKVDWNGKVLKTIPTPHHTGDIAFADGRLYAAVALMVDGKKAGRIMVFDEDLKPVKEVNVDRGIDGITCMNGILYLGMGAKEQPSSEPHRVNILGRFSAETLEEILPRAEFDYGVETSYGFQDLANDGENVYAAFYTADGDAPMAVFDAGLNIRGRGWFDASQGLDVAPAHLCAGKRAFVCAETKAKKGLVMSCAVRLWFPDKGDFQ